MNGYGIAATVLSVMLVGGLAVATVAGAIAVTRHPDRFDNERNAKRYVAPAMGGALVALLSAAGLILEGVIAIIDAIT